MRPLAFGRRVGPHASAFKHALPPIWPPSVWVALSYARYYARTTLGARRLGLTLLGGATSFKRGALRAAGALAGGGRGALPPPGGPGPARPYRRWLWFSRNTWEGVPRGLCVEKLKNPGLLTMPRGGPRRVPRPTHLASLASWHPLAHILAFLSNIRGLEVGMVLPYHNATGILCLA